MKHEFTAKTDINRRTGDILITAAAGDTLELSDREAEAAAQFEELEYKGFIAETAAEKSFAEQSAAAETKEDLLKLKRDTLVEKAVSLGIPVNSDTKAELAAAIIERRETLALTDVPVKEDVNAEAEAEAETENPAQADDKKDEENK